MNLKTWVGLTLCSLSLAAVAQHDAAGHRALVREVIHMNSIPGVFLAGMKYGIARKEQATPESTRQAECVVNTIDRELVEAKFVDAYMAHLSAAQASELVQFFKTSSGQKWARHMADIASGRIAVTTSLAPPQLSDADLQEMERFMTQTEGGKRFAAIGKKPVMEAAGALMPMIKDLEGKCS